METGKGKRIESQRTNNEETGKERLEEEIKDSEIKGKELMNEKLFLGQSSSSGLQLTPLNNGNREQN